MFKNFGDKSFLISTLNEPIATYVGYGLGVFAPGIKGEKNGRQACHNILLAHGKAVKTFRDMNVKSKIGIVVDIWNRVPLNGNDEDDVNLANSENEKAHLFFLDALLKGRYSDYIIKYLNDNNSLPYFEDNDFNLISQPLDFWGLNSYNRVVVSQNNSEEIIEDIKKRGGNFLDNNQEFYPKAVYDSAKMLREKYKLKIPIYVTENGTYSSDNVIKNGIIQDDDRIKYFKGFIEWIDKANNEGLDIRGYYLWTLMDNFEWTAGFNTKFGLYHTDLNTLKRTPKKSAIEYKIIIKNNSL